MYAPDPAETACNLLFFPQLNYMNSDDIWENGTVVRYGARFIALGLVVAGIYAFRYELRGKTNPRAVDHRKTQ